jgi:hypothetical protein
MSETVPEKGIVIASQIVRDVKVGGGQQRKELLKDVARLRAGLLVKSYIPGDKVNCDFKPLCINTDGTLTVEVFGGMLHGSDKETGLDPHFHHRFHLPLNGPLTMQEVTSMSLEDLLMKHCSDVTVDDGGNAQNMAIDMCLTAVSALEKQKIKMLVATSSNPLKRLPDSVRDKIQHLVTFAQLPDVPDRIAIQLPWQNDTGKPGTFGLNTEPLDISASLRTLLKEREDLALAVRKAVCFVSSDLAFEVLREHGQPGRYINHVNSSTKWRSTVAARAYGTDLILPMNHKEAADVVHVIKHVGSEEELHNVKRVAFPNPLKTNGNEVDIDSLTKLDDLLLQFSRYNQQHLRNSLVAFNYPITFEEHGGLLVGSRNRHSIVAYTSTPDDDASKRLLDQYGDPAEMNNGDIETMGAGDAAAAMVAIFNTIDPQEFIVPHLEGREITNSLLHQYAQTIFLSALCRIVGTFLIRTKRTHFSNIRLDTFRDLFKETAKSSLEAARQTVNNPQAHSLKDLKGLGIKVVTWELGSIANPDNE